MELLAEISDESLGLGGKRPARYSLRKAVRCVLLNRKGELGLLYVSKRKYHKLPGGGIEKGETEMQALRREVAEETGAEMRVLGPVGKTVERRDAWKLRQVSRCYIARAKGSPGRPAFTPSEKASGFRFGWAGFGSAIRLLQGDKPKDYEGKFIVRRDLALIRKAKAIKAKFGR